MITQIIGIFMSGLLGMVFFALGEQKTKPHTIAVFEVSFAGIFFLVMLYILLFYHR